MPMPPRHLFSLYRKKVLHTPSWSKGNLYLIHELDLTATHTSKASNDELYIIKGLLGM